MNQETRFSHKGHAVVIRCKANTHSAAHYDIFVDGTWRACRWFASSAITTAMYLIDKEEGK